MKYPPAAIAATISAIRILFMRPVLRSETVHLPREGRSSVRWAPCSARARDDERHVLDEAVAPILALLRRAHDRMAVRRRVLARMAVRRRVAATDLPTRHAHPEMNPAVADREAVFAAGDALRKLDDFDLIEVGTG